MSDYWYRPAPGEPDIVRGSLLSVPHMWATFPPHRVTITDPPAGDGLAWGVDGNGNRMRVRILSPAWDA